MLVGLIFLTNIPFWNFFMIATRLAFGQFLAQIGDNMPELVVLDAEMSNSTFTNLFGEKFPDRFIQCFIAEQNMMSVALGLNLGGFVPVCATFAAFLTRCFDQIRMSQYTFPKTNLKIAGSHCGISIGSDGPSQMALEDIAMFATINGSIILYPSGETATQELTKIMLKHHGISYLRLTRDEMPDLYQNKNSQSQDIPKSSNSQNQSSIQNSKSNPNYASNYTPDYSFKVGGSSLFKNLPKNQLENSKIVLDSFNKNLPKITLIGAGITVHECFKAQEKLKEEFEIQIIDLYSVKPFDQLTVLKAVLESQCLITVEDHSPFGGIGSIIGAFLAGFNISELKTQIQNWQKENSQNNFQENLSKKFQNKLQSNSGLSKAILRQIQSNFDPHNLSELEKELEKNNFVSFLTNLEIDNNWRGVHSLSVTQIPKSGSKEKLLEWAKIDSSGIIEKVIQICD